MYSHFYYYLAIMGYKMVILKNKGHKVTFIKYLQAVIWPSG